MAAHGNEYTGVSPNFSDSRLLYTPTKFSPTVTHSATSPASPHLAFSALVKYGSSMSSNHPCLLFMVSLCFKNPLCHAQLTTSTATSGSNPPPLLREYFNRVFPLSGPRASLFSLTSVYS